MLNQIKQNYIFLTPIAVFALVFIFGLIGLFEKPITEAALLNYDGAWYQKIANEGYSLHGLNDEQSSVAFFPLFAFVWKALGVSIFAIVTLNILAFTLAQFLAAKTWGLNTKQSLFFMSFSSLIFCYIPYSESLFYLFAMIILIGLEKKSILLICMGIFLAGITRSASLFFIPAILFISIISFNKTSFLGLLNTFYMLSSAVFALLIVGVIQFQDTGEWFSFFAAQKSWGNHLQVPKWPLVTWDNKRNLINDGAAFLVSVIALGLLLKTCFLYFTKKLNGQAYSLAFYFSAVILAEMGFYVLLFRGGSLFSLNRFVFASPFCAIFFYELFTNASLSKKQIIIFIALIYTFLELAFGAWYGRPTEHLIFAIQFFILGLICFLWLKAPSTPWIFTVVIAINFILQLHYFNLWIAGKWVG